MDLHRTTGKPDWEDIPAAERTSIQSLAAASHGIITPPNIISLIGFAIVLYGLYTLLQEHYLTGLIALAIGRGLDVVDGLVAQATGTKSPLGELVDAAIDKFGTLLTLVVLFVAGIGEWWLLTLLLLPQILISLVSLYKRSHNQIIHPTRIGKFSMAGLWVSIAALLLVSALGLQLPHPLVALVYAITLISSGLGFYALWQYSTGRD